MENLSKKELIAISGGADGDAAFLAGFAAGVILKTQLGPSYYALKFWASQIF